MPLRGTTGSSSILTAFDVGGVEDSERVSSFGEPEAPDVAVPFSGGEGMRKTWVSVAAGEEGDSFEGFVPLETTGDVSSRLNGELVAELHILGLLASGPLDPQEAVEDAVDIP